MALIGIYWIIARDATHPTVYKAVVYNKELYNAIEWQQCCCWETVIRREFMIWCHGNLKE